MGYEVWSNCNEQCSFAIPQWVLNVDVPVQGDGAEVQDGRRGAHDVERDPRVAELSPEHPVAQQVIHHGKRHHQAGHEQICDGERCEEQVADASQGAVRVDGNTHQDVTRDGQEDHQREEHPCAGMHKNVTTLGVYGVESIVD